LATSNSSDFTATRDQIIDSAARKVNAIAQGITMSSAMRSDFAFDLNAMVKNLQATGIHVWTMQEATLFPQVDQVQYGLSLTTTDHVTQSYVSTALDGAAASGATTITVDSITGISNADNIGVVVDDGTIHWTTVNGAPAGSTVTLTTGLDDSSADGNVVYAYTSKIVRPLKVVDARRYTVADARETPLFASARRDYQALPDKTQTGAANQFFYDPQLSTGQLYIWPAPADVDDIIKFTWHRPIEDFDAATDNPDLPQEWIEPLVWNLALRLTAQYPVSRDIYSRIGTMAATTLDNVMGFDREEESIQFQPDIGW